MTTMTLHTRRDTGMAGSHTAPAVHGRIPGAARTRPWIGQAVFLDRSSVLCIRDGRETRIRVCSGVLWVTEENSVEDRVLLPGDDIAIARQGTAIVSPCPRARIVIEVAPGAALPRAVEMILANGKRRHIAFAAPTPRSPAMIATRIATVFGNVLALMYRIGTSYADRFLPRHLRRSMPHSTRKVERAVIDDWLMWRRE